MVREGNCTMTRVCVIGSNSDNYTRMVTRFLDEIDIEYVLIRERGLRTHQSTLTRIALRIDSALNSHPYRALPALSLYKYLKVLAAWRNRRGPRYRELIATYEGYEPATTEKYTTPMINHVRTLRLLGNQDWDLCLLAGVGIVDQAVLDKFKICINAHPARLPECRGGGALINTLRYGLEPAVSVHRVTKDIDAGPIVSVRDVPIEKDDNMQLISLRLEIECARELVHTAQRVCEGEPLKDQSNDGKLHYWRDCTIDAQKAADRELDKRLSALDI